MQSFLNSTPFYPANSAPTPNRHPIGNQPPKFALPNLPHAPTMPNMPVAQPKYYFADCGINFGRESNDSIEHILRGLTSAVSLLLDPEADKCCPNIPPQKNGSWCFPEVNYTNVQWTENNYWAQPQPIWQFDQKCQETTKSVTQKFSDFFCR
jgi:hypothetical protein